MHILSELKQHRLTNARKPTGLFGRLLIRAMNISHYQMTSWGVGHLPIGEQDTVLDVGCGGGGTLNQLAKKAANGKVYGIDFSTESVMVSRKTNQVFIQMGRVVIQQSCVSCMPFADCRFDLVTAVNTHNYWPDFVNDLQEILRVLKPGGKLIIIGSVYQGGKKDKRNHKFATLINIAFPSLKELRDYFLNAGYLEVQLFEEYNRGWMCIIGRKAVNPSSFASMFS